jgi:hypothetical protein
MSPRIGSLPIQLNTSKSMVDLTPDDNNEKVKSEHPKLQAATHIDIDSGSDKRSLISTLVGDSD